MIGICNVRQLLFLAIGCLPLFATAVANENGFAKLLEEIHQLNNLDAREVAPLAKVAQTYVDTNPTLYNRVRLVAALAPLDSIQTGYREARHKLISFLGESQASRHSAELYPLLRYAIGDLARRNGEYRYAFRQLIDSGKLMNRDTPESLRARLLEAVYLTNLEAGFPQFSLTILENLNELTSLDPARANLLEAEIYWQMRKFEEVEQLLDGTASLISHPEATHDLMHYWLRWSWLSLARGNLIKAEEYLQKANVQNASPSSANHGEALFLEALLFLEGGEIQWDLCRSKLIEARQFFKEMGTPGRYPYLLHNAFFIYENVRTEHVPRPLLEEASLYAHDEGNLRAFGGALAAWAELSLLEEFPNANLVADRYRLSLRYSTHFLRKMGELQIDWITVMPIFLNPPDHAGESIFFYYALMFLLVLVIILLVLVLRIRGQRHLNQQLAEAVHNARVAEEAAEESNRVKTQFLANISHEIKTPMAGLVGMASLLDELVTDATQRKYIGTIRTCSQNLVVLVNDLLDLGRMDSGTFEVEAAPFEVRKTVDYCMEMVRDKATLSGLRLEAEVAPSVPEMLQGDSTRIGQIMTNLMTNAIKFTDKGHVRMNVRFDPSLGNSGNLKITVEDTGIGIAQDKLHSVFEPFSQEGGSRARNREGSGLGLAICQKLVEIMGGAISVESKLDEGSRFEVVIPLKQC